MGVSLTRTHILQVQSAPFKIENAGKSPIVSTEIIVCQTRAAAFVHRPHDYAVQQLEEIKEINYIIRQIRGKASELTSMNNTMTLLTKNEFRFLLHISFTFHLFVTSRAYDFKTMKSVIAIVILAYLNSYNVSTYILKARLIDANFGACVFWKSEFASSVPFLASNESLISSSIDSLNEQ